ncbi:MAG: Unknown protein [uncultured Sulfurovum sp.]|uniref:Uncharacterized protein n=1 Tax=uncultured Sulfurovum sp. TaxID=269237 RepID=A0A6S6T286_9BACT|nr:MAG: Unknown protein [uncultured Sulfurovum sp.]
MSGCVTNAIPIKIATVKPEEGGNPEVNLNLCLKETHQARIKCLDRFFPMGPNIFIVPTDGKRILLAGRGESIERTEIILKKTDEIILLNIDTRNVKIPLSINIATAKPSQKGNSLVFTIPVQEIKEKIILRDQEGNIVLQYRVIRE